MAWTHSILAISVVPLSVGCMMELEAYEDVTVVYQPVDVDNSSELNGRWLNGRWLNGERLNSAHRPGRSVSGVVLDGTQFGGLEDGQPISGTDFIGMEFDAELDDESTQEVRIDDISDSGLPGLQFFSVKYYDNGSWYDICENGEKAIPLHGKWNSSSAAHIDDGNVFTFACRGAAIAKCVEWGYRQWGTKQECRGGDCKQQSLHSLHLACIRMVRADYCGDGKTWTEDGTTVDIFDGVGVLAEDSMYGEGIEADWSADGAHCIQHTRWEDSASSTPALDYIQANCPERLAGVSAPNDTTCTPENSTFHTAIGFDTPLLDRWVIRNKSAQSYRF